MEFLIKKSIDEEDFLLYKVYKGKYVVIEAQILIEEQQWQSTFISGIQRLSSTSVFPSSILLELIAKDLGKDSLEGNSVDGAMNLWLKFGGERLKGIGRRVRIPLDKLSQYNLYNHLDFIQRAKITFKDETRNYTAELLLA